METEKVFIQNPFHPRIISVSLESFKRLAAEAVIKDMLTRTLLQVLIHKRCILEDYLLSFTFLSQVFLLQHTKTLSACQFWRVLCPAVFLLVFTTCTTLS